MLKRVTSLLVMAASIVSIIPAMAEDYKTANVEEGTVYSAVSEGLGRYIVDAEINDEDEAFYFVANGKYTKLDMDTSYTFSDFYADKYAEFEDTNGNYYYVDVTSGKQTDEYDRQTVIDGMERKLRNNIKKDNDGRFDKDDYVNSTVQAEFTGDGAVKVFISGPGGDYSRFNYKLKAANLNGEQYSTIFANIDGNYIDADYNLGKVPIYTTTGSSITFQNTEDTKEIKENGKTYELKAQIENISALCDQVNDIYRTAKLTIWRKEKDEADNKYENITDQIEFGSKNNHHKGVPYDGGVEVVQKISKSQASDTIDGIKYAKDVMTCFITDEDGNEEHVLGLGDTSDLGTSVDWAGGDVALVTGSLDGIASHFYDANKKKYYVQNFNLKSKNGYYYLDLGDTDEVDADAWTIGAGSIYCLSHGYVEKWIYKDNQFEKMYKVDGGMTDLSCSFDSTVLVWNNDKEIFSMLYTQPTSDDKKDTTTGAAVTVGTATTGWIKDNNGSWSFNNADGSKKTGWLKDSDSWYYLKSNGIMATGWINDGEEWYYCNESGAMLANTTIDGYVLSDNGTWINQ